eukprot:10621564-Alexandrium_andersonii.AAC.1
MSASLVGSEMCIRDRFALLVLRRRASFEFYLNLIGYRVGLDCTYIGPHRLGAERSWGFPACARSPAPGSSPGQLGGSSRVRARRR